MLGFPQQALLSSRAAITLAQESRYPANLALPRAHAAWLYQFRREASEVQAQAEALLALAHEQGFFLPVIPQEGGGVNTAEQRRRCGHIDQIPLACSTALPMYVAGVISSKGCLACSGMSSR